MWTRKRSRAGSSGDGIRDGTISRVASASTIPARPGRVVGAARGPRRGSASCPVLLQQVRAVALALPDHRRLWTREVDHRRWFVRFVPSVEDELEPMSELLLDVAGVDEDL